MKKIIVLLLVQFHLLQNVFCQDLFKETKQQLQNTLENRDSSSFKEAVFKTENAYMDGNLDYNEFYKRVTFLKFLIEANSKTNLISYKGKDFDRVNLYASLFKVITDTILISVKDTQSYWHLPFIYDFEDIFGAKDWSNMFVTKLLRVKAGNCHSLPYLYKILCDELHLPCNLALAPNHLYIKHRAEKGGMYNTELTSATFPIDAWLMASGYITLEAIQNGIYMDTLSEKESIALCVIDLAQGYDHKYPDNDGKFIIECCDLALQHFPDYINAMMLKAETLLRLLKQLQKDTHYTYLKEVTKLPDGKAKWDEMNALYGKMLQLGYRQMPEQMYVEWLTSLKTEKEKYTNKQAPGATKD
jgi:hypothetical protein